MRQRAIDAVGDGERARRDADARQETLPAVPDTRMLPVALAHDPPSTSRLVCDHTTIAARVGRGERCVVVIGGTPCATGATRSSGSPRV
jgi:hypothetical protein